MKKKLLLLLLILTSKASSVELLKKITGFGFKGSTEKSVAFTGLRDLSGGNASQPGLKTLVDESKCHVITAINLFVKEKEAERERLREKKKIKNRREKERKKKRKKKRKKEALEASANFVDEEVLGFIADDLENAPALSIASVSPALNDFVVAASAPVEAPLTPTVETNWSNFNFKYTKTIGMWQSQPERILQSSGYLNLRPTNDYENIRRSVFVRTLAQCNNDVELAKSIIVASHTAPMLLDRYALKNGLVRVKGNEISVVLPVIKKTSNGLLVYGSYEVLARQISDHDLLIYHKVFKPIEKNTFVHQLNSNIDPATEENLSLDDDVFEEEWQPAVGSWLEDDTNPLYSVLSNSELQEVYYVLKESK